MLLQHPLKTWDKPDNKTRDCYNSGEYCNPTNNTQELQKWSTIWSTQNQEETDYENEDNGSDTSDCTIPESPNYMFDTYCNSNSST